MLSSQIPLRGTTGPQPSDILTNPSTQGAPSTFPPSQGLPSEFPQALAFASPSGPTAPEPIDLTDINREFRRFYSQLSITLVARKLKSQDLTNLKKRPNLAQMNTAVMMMIPFTNIPLKNGTSLLADINQQITNLQTNNPNSPQLAGLLNQKAQLERIIQELEPINKSLSDLKANIAEIRSLRNNNQPMPLWNNETTIGIKLLAITGSLKAIVQDADNTFRGLSR